MPTRHRRPTQAPVDPRRFIWDNAVGPDRYFQTPGYADEAAAERAWHQVRRDAWAVCHRSKIPKAAIVYDGMSCTAHEAAFSGVGCSPYPLDEVLAAITEDLAACVKFEADDPAGAQQVADYLRLWRCDLAALEVVAHELAKAPHGGAATKIYTGKRYGQGEQSC